MKQLVELQKQADEFKKLNTEVIIVFREESEGANGLKKIKQRTKTSFTLATDLNKKSSTAYSRRRMTFDNFVIDKSGVVKEIIPGTLRGRAKADKLLAVLKTLEGK